MTLPLHRFALLQALFLSGCTSSPDSKADSNGGSTGEGGSPPANSSGSDSAYLLFNPTSSKIAYLTDLSGQEVHRWTTTSKPGLGMRLLSDGQLLRAEAVSTKTFSSSSATGGAGGRITLYDWDGAKVWTLPYISSTYLQHHDVETLPSGNVLFIAWEKKTSAEATAAGRSSATIPSSGEVWSDTIIEMNPTTKTVVWEWHLWDHLLDSGQTALDHPELVDPNAATSSSTEDWAHLNSVRYSSSLDQILVSAHNFGEIWIIDHSTTTAEAKTHAGGTSGKGGDLLYRWGNPSSYGASGSQQLYSQHDARWIDEGLPGASDITIFDNGSASKRPYSRAVQITPPLSSGAYTSTSGTAFDPASPTWTYKETPATNFFAKQISSAQRVASGNTVLCDGPNGEFFEVDSSGAVQWSFQLTATGTAGVETFRVERIETTDSRLSGRTLTAGSVVVSQ